jgi:hypothetical protein
MTDGEADHQGTASGPRTPPRLDRPRPLPDTPTVPWDEIAHRYRRGRLMGPFAAQILESPYTHGIHGLITVSGLLIAPTTAIPWNGPYLRVDARMGEMRFEDVDGGAVQTAWRTPPEKAFAALERFIHRQRWFVEYREAEPPA